MRLTRHSLTALTVLGAFALAAPGRAQTTTLTFSDLAQPGTGSYSVPTYSAGGYLFTDAKDGAPVNFGFYQTGNGNYVGRPALFGAASSNNSVITLTRPDGTPFDAISIALSGLVSNSASYAPVTFTGQHTDGTQVTQTDSPVTFGFTTFTFGTGFTDLTSLTWSQTYTAPRGHQFTDVALSAAPEPTALLGLGLGAAVLTVSAVRATRRRARPA